MDHLNEADIVPEPMTQFRRWFDEMLAADTYEPYAMTLATSSLSGEPSARMVLLKRIDDDGFRFYTNYQSHKGSDLNSNPRAALVFFWATMHRQVRVEGTIERTSIADSDAYFASRPRGSQIAARASRQSAILAERADLDRRVEELEQEYAGRDVPRPSYWGGYLVRPVVVEFWQGRRDRLHDRLVYRLHEDRQWRIERLAP